MTHLLGQIMMRSIGLDGQPPFRMEEIEHIGSDGMLSPDSQSVQTLTGALGVFQGHVPQSGSEFT
jgi:hypothetical protein